VARHRNGVRMGIVLSAVCGYMSIIGAGAQVADATSIDFCGRVIASDAYCPGPASSNWGTRWTYTSSSYGGAGSIDRLWAGMADVSYGYYTKFAYAYNATFVNGCWYKVSGTNNNYGISFQHEASGASHTINGHNDNSPNHTGCIGDFQI
jgi:hypothetical protein